MENMLGEAVKRIGEKVEPVAADIREKAEPVVEKLRDGAEEAIDAVKQAARDIGARIGNAAPGADIKNEFFDALEDEALEMKEAARQKADDMQKKLEALMRGETDQ